MAASPCLFLVPARGGSKGVLRKNLVPLAGRSLISHVLTSARDAMRHLGYLLCRLVVSTEDQEIADTARSWGAEIPFMRPAYLAQDESSTIDVVLHALHSLKEREAYEPETVVLLQATSPLTDPEDICGATRLFWKTGGPVVTITANPHPVEWSYSLEDGRLHGAQGNAVGRRQVAAATYRLNGAVYVASPNILQKQQTFLTTETRGYIMPPERSIDIDTMQDIMFADTLLLTRARQIPPIEIGERKIGPGHPCFIIAEAGVNHNGDINLAHRLIDAAAESGADAVKFQTFAAAKLAAPAAPKAEYQRMTTGAHQSQYEMLKALELSPDNHLELKKHAEESRLIFLSSPFDEDAADFLESLGIAAFKIPSGEITNAPFLAHIARKGRPVLLSTGMSTLQDVESAVRILRENGNPRLALFHCVSCYPTNPEDCNLRAMETMRCMFRVPVGFSDHTLSVAVPVASVSLGGDMVEKHLTLDQRLPGPDHATSLEPAQFRFMVESIRAADSALGSAVKQPLPREMDTAQAARKSLAAACEIKAGTLLTRQCIVALRPGSGVSPSDLPQVVGRRTKRDIQRGDLLAWEDLE